MKLCGFRVSISRLASTEVMSRTKSGARITRVVNASRFLESNSPMRIRTMVRTVCSALSVGALAFSCSVATLAAFAAAPLSAQATRETGATISGRVIDAASHAPVSGATVTLLRANVAVQQAHTDESGRWSASVPSGGSYVLRVQRIGYASESHAIDAAAEYSAAGADISLTPVPVSLDATVVTAARRLQALKDAAVTTDIVSREEIERTGASDAATVLGQQNGIVPTAGGTPGSGSSVLLGGLSGERVLVLLDGEPIEGRLAGSLDLSRIPTSIIDHIEIVRGPQATLYGSDALGGVINIVTRTANAGPAAATAELLGGTYDRLDGSAQASGSVGSLALTGDVGHRDIALAPGNSEMSGGSARRWDGLVAGHWTPSSAFTLDASALGITEHQQFTSSPSAFIADNTQLNLRTSAQWQWADGTQRITPSIAYSSFDHLPSTSGGDLTGEDQHETENNLKGDIVYAGMFGPHGLTTGIDLTREEYNTDRITGNDRAITSVDPFAQFTAVFGALSVVPGIRLTDNDQWGAHWTPELALLYRPFGQLAIRASVADGFRSPDLEELYLNFVNTSPGAGYSVMGNPDLQPETSRNVSASVEWAGEHLYARLEGFENHYSNFIETAYVGQSNGLLEFTYDNVADGWIRGATLTTELVAGAARFDAGYTITRTGQSATSSPLYGVPGATARLGAGYTLVGGLHVSLTALYTGSAQIGDPSGAPGTVTQSAFTRINAQVTQTITRNATAVFGADNLLNTSAENWPEAAGRQLYLGVRLNAQATPR
jgi:outer membrane receptor for ferrienterochelin and colicins